MVAKPLTVLIYILGGLLVAAWPILVSQVLLNARGPIRVWQDRFNRCAASQGGTQTVLSYSCLPAVALGLLAGSTLVWWRAKFSDISITEAAIYAVISLLAMVLLVPQLRPMTLPGSHRPTRWLLIGIAVIAFGILSFSTGVTTRPQVVIVAWHHWSAFIGPSELLLSGARIFHDFPAQYGFGPTALIAAACGTNCWSGMYFVVAATTMLFTVLILFIVASARIKSAWTYGVLFAVVTVACFFWDAYPPLVSSPAEVPSVGGMRFLPAVVLVAGLIWIGRTPGIAKYWATFGHIAYAIGAIWSPESLFFVGFVWWPYFILRHTTEAGPGRFLPELLRAVAIIFCVSAGIFVGSLALYRSLYGIFPDPSAYLAYMLYPPGVLPIEPTGPIWFSAVAIVLSFMAVNQRMLEGGDRTELDRSILVLLLGYATLSYCMGRSHSNNFLNVLPFTVLMLVNAFASRLPVVFRTLSAAMLVSLLGWLSIFGWGVWKTAITDGRAVEFSPDDFVMAFSYQNRDTAAFAKKYFNVATAEEDFASITQAISQISKSSADPIAVMDGNYLLLQTAPPKAWNAFHGPGNYYFLPSAWRQEFLKRTKDRLRESGWMIIRKNVSSEWTADLLSAYSIAQDFNVGDYRVIHLTPRTP